MNEEPKQATPSEGGCYIRDPVTGELTRVQETQEAPQGAPAAEAPASQDLGQGQELGEQPASENQE